MKNLIKRYNPICAVGTFICSHCVIESAKNIIGLQFPELFQLVTHKKEDDSMNTLAMKCLNEIILKNELQGSLFVMDSKLLMTNNFPGTLFIGAGIDKIGETENKAEFFERIKSEISSLDLMKTKVDEDMTEDDVNHYNEMFTVAALSDIVVTLSKKKDENDVDDMDIGYEEGMNNGMEAQYHLVQVALYKMFKKKKIKSLDFIIDEIHNTINGMDDNDFKMWSRNFKKYTVKKLKKEHNIEGEK